MDYKKYLSGGLSGIVEVICTHPLDYVKTIKQQYTQHNIPIHLIKNNYKNLYKGVIPRIVGVMPMRFVFWGVQDNSYSYYYSCNNNKLHSGILAGITGGVCQTIIDNPIEILKIKMITNQSIKLRDLIQNRGFTATLIRNTGFAICISSICFDKNEKTNIEKFCYSATAGIIGSIMTQPIDYVKTLQQSNDTRSIYKILVNTYKDSPKKLYIGGLNRALLSFFSMGVGYIAYDNIYKLL